MLSLTLVIGRSSTMFDGNDHYRSSSMFQQWLKNFQASAGTASEPDAQWIERLTALLLVEVARADAEVGSDELAAIDKAIKASSSSLSAEEVEQIIATARDDAENTVSFHEHVRQINSGFSRAQKLQLIEQMWRVAYADGDLDKYEEYTIRKMADLLFVEHAEFIRAKLRVLDSAS